MSLVRFFIPSLAVAGGGLSSFAALHDRFPGDLSLSLLVQKINITGMSAGMEFLSTVGDPLVMAGIAAVFAGYLFYRGRRADGVALVLSMGVALGSTYLLKELIDRPRPSPDLVSVWGQFEGMSFPSGTSLNSVVGLGALAYLVPSLVRLPWGKNLLRGVLVVLILLIGSSRIFLGTHWPSDVLGGFILGGFFLSVLVEMARLISRPGLLANPIR